MKLEKLELKNLPDPKHDYLVASNAMILADMIRDYWSAKGHTVKVWVKRNTNSETYGVRSNLVNGMPRK